MCDGRLLASERLVEHAVAADVETADHHIALYLNRRDGVPVWEVGSSMLCEIYSLILWATVGVLLR
jgi:hypothetical protein